MTFDKTQYWKNRNEGKRGQGEYTVPRPTAEDHPKSGSHYMQVGGRLVSVNRVTSRRKIVDHRLTSKTARVKSNEEAEAVAGRVKRKEAGERERIARLREQVA